MPTALFSPGSAEAATMTLPAHMPGQMIVLFAFRDGSVTPPTIPSGVGWITIHNSAGANLCSNVLVYKVAQTSTETCGTFTNANALICHVYNAGVLQIGSNSSTGGSSATVNYPALTLTNGGGLSWVAAFAGHRSTNGNIGTAPAGMVNRVNLAGVNADAAGHDTDAGIDDWPSTNVASGETASGYRVSLVELMWVPKAESLREAFATQDAAIWQYDGTASVVAGELNLTPIAGGGNLIYTQVRYDMTNSSAFIHMTQNPGVGTGTIYCGIEINFGDLTNSWAILWRNGGYVCREKVADVDSDTTVAGITDTWMRIRHSVSTVYWETSATGAHGTWTVRRSKTVGVPQINNAFISITSGYSGTETPGVAKFDSYNIPTTPVRVVPWFSGGQMGSDIIGLSAADRSRILALASTCGHQAIRIDCAWQYVEGTQGTYDWTDTDTGFNSIAAAGLPVVGALGSAPVWAGGDVNTFNAYPSLSFLTQWRAFITAAVTRYQAICPVWEIWNEPNAASRTASFTLDSDPIRYAAILQAGYEAVKAAQPNSIVLLGGIASMPAPREGHTWMEDLYAQGIINYFDHANHHPYCFPDLPNDAVAWSAINLMTNLRNVMTDNGDTAKQIWMTEFGAPTGTNATAVTAANQALTLTQCFAFQKATSWVGPAFPYSLKDRGTDLTQVEDNFGMVDFTWGYKAAVAAVQRACGGATRGFNGA